MLILFPSLNLANSINPEEIFQAYFHWFYPHH
jgi:hypothetical protein